MEKTPVKVELWHVLCSATGGYIVLRICPKGLFDFHSNHYTRRSAEDQALKLNRETRKRALLEFDLRI